MNHDNDLLSKIDYYSSKLVSTFLCVFLVVATIAAIVVAISCPIKAHEVPWQKTNTAFYDCYTNHDKHPNVNPITLAFGCLAVSETDMESLTITSGCDRKSYHHGKFCAAIDMFPDEYAGRDIREFADEYARNFYQMVVFLDDNPWIAQRCAIGAYPPHCKADGSEARGTLHVHWDCMGKGRRWAVIRGKQVPIVDGLREFRRFLRGC